MKRIAMIISMSLLTSIYGFSQTKQELIKELITVMHSDSLIDKTFSSIMPAMMKQLKIDSKDSASQAKAKESSTRIFKLASEFSKKIYKEDVPAIYDKHFTENEIKDYIRFYKTPSGQKILKEQPNIQKDISMIIFQKYMPAFLDSIKVQTKSERTRRSPRRP